MSAERKEGGFLKFLKKLFQRGPESHSTLQRLPPQEAAQTQHKKEEKKSNDFSRQVIEEINKITPSHPARQLLKGANFSEETIRRNEDLGRLLLDIVRQPENSSIYHDTKWLAGTLARLHDFDTRLAADPSQGGVLSGIEENFENLVRAAQRGDARIVETEEMIRRTKVGQSAPTPETWEAALNAIPEDTEEGRMVHEAAKILATDTSEERGFSPVALAMSAAMKRLSETVNQTDENDLKRFNQEYLRYQNAYEKLGKYYTQLHHEGGEFREEIRVRWGGKEELMRKAMEENPEYRDYWFYRILQPVLYNEKMQDHRELYSLWVAGDMEAYLKMVSDMKDEAGNNVGRKLVSHYMTLKNTVFQSHDMDYYAAHPTLDMKEFMTSTALFTNQYVDFALQDPLVALAKRAYEMALLQIRENHNGYIPREYLAWTRGRMGIELDRMVERLVLQAIENGQLHHVKTDPVTGEALTNEWQRIQIDPDRLFTLDDLYGGEPPQSTSWRRQAGELKLASALKQAKGLGLLDMRLLEIMGRSKGTGAALGGGKEEDNYTFTMNGFNSVPYEGIVRHIEPIIHYFTRWNIGGDIFQPFFNMMITEKPDWDPEDMRQLIRWHFDGETEKIREKWGEALATRLNTMDNVFGFSGMWGTFTKWRTGDATRDWDDWQNERLSTANKLSLIGDKLIRDKGSGEGHDASAWQVGNLTDEKKTLQYYLEGEDYRKGKDGKTAKEFYDELREEYRRALISSGGLEYMRIAQDEKGYEFEKNWRTVGIRQASHDRGTSYEKLLQQHFEGVKEKHGKEKIDKEMEERQKKLERAYKTRIWIQAAMRSPLAVAREIKTDYEISGYKREGPLRKKIIWDLLGIDLDEIGQDRTPKKMEQDMMQPILDLEGAVFDVSQIALRDIRNLTDDDFNTIKDNVLREKARKYWHIVREEMLGSREASGWYEKLGIEDADLNMPVGLRFHRINWKRIDEIHLEKVGHHGISIFDNPEGFTSKLLTAKLIDRDWRYLFSTEDMGWEYLNVGALGERNEMRRAGDLASHVEFNQLLEQYLTTFVGGRLDVDKAMEHLQKMWVAMSGDFGDISVDACGKILYATAMMYRKADWAWKIPFLGPLGAFLKDTSIAQIIYGRSHADSKGPNEIYRMIHKAEELKIIPPHAINQLTGKRTWWSEWDAHLMEERLGATKDNMIYEIITMAILMSIILTLWRAFTAKSEEDEDGGGGGGGHH